MQAAIGKIVDDMEVTNPADITPLHVKSSAKTRVVEVTKVLVPSLIIPGHFVGKGKNKRPACLCDFSGAGKTSFWVLLPLMMMRDHVASTHMCTYEPRVNLVPIHQRITPPAPAK
jgi:hypothetical protein